MTQASPSDVGAVQKKLAAQGIKLNVKAFTEWLGARRTAPQVEALALAWACAQGQNAAIAYFEKEYLSQATRALKKMNVSAAIADELISWLRFELFAREKGALIATYSGKGDLGGWVRAIVAHEALKRIKKERREVSPDDVEELPMPSVELASMRGTYGPQFTRALAESFRELSVEQRNVLRQYFLDGLTIDELAKLHDVHRATAARRVQSAREALVEKVKSSLVASLKMGETSVRQVITLSNLEESLSQLLRRTK